MMLGLIKKKLHRADGHGEKPAKVQLKRFRTICRQAQAGDGDAQYQVGLAYLQGKIVPASVSSAAHWLEKASQSGIVAAQCALASLYLGNVPDNQRTNLGERLVWGDTGPSRPDVHKALHWARQAAAAGSADGLAILGFICMSGPDDVRDPVEAVACYRAAAEGGSAKGALGLGAAILAEGTAQAERLEAAHKALIQAAEGDEPLASYYLGTIAEMRKDVEEAIVRYRQAAQRGVVQAQTRLGFLLLDGPTGHRDPLHGESWLRRAANAGSVEAAVRVADLYARPHGSLPANYAEAAIWYEKAAERGHAAAARVLGHLYLSDAKIGQNPSQAADWLRRAVELGSAEAVGELGTVLRSDRITIRAILTRSLESLRNRAGQGDHAAGLQLGLYYNSTKSGLRDPAEAIHYLRQAAVLVPLAQLECGKLLLAQGDDPAALAEARRWLTAAAQSALVDAQVLAGEMMLNGRGGAKDPLAAVSLFQKAADQQHPGAMFALGAMFGGGRGIPADTEKALFWLAQAAERGHQVAQTALSSYMARNPQHRLRPSLDADQSGPVAKPGVDARTPVLAVA